MDSQGIIYPRVKINTCSQAELMRLPGIGPQISERIMMMRKLAPLDWNTFVQIPYVKATDNLFHSVDFSCEKDLFSDLFESPAPVLKPQVVSEQLHVLPIKTEQFKSDIAQALPLMDALTQPAPKQTPPQATGGLDPSWLDAGQNKMKHEATVQLNRQVHRL